MTSVPAEVPVAPRGPDGEGQARPEGAANLLAAENGQRLKPLPERSPSTGPGYPYKTMLNLTKRVAEEIVEEVPV